MIVLDNGVVSRKLVVTFLVGVDDAKPVSPHGRAAGSESGITIGAHVSKALITLL